MAADGVRMPERLTRAGVTEREAEVLSAVAENESGSPVADRCERLARQCKQLDGAIEAFVSSALASQASQGSA